ncbi:MAG: hypothetical protein NTW11_01845 [Candidatus Staskawiczbacteria bacterium]|nr:hypothetical protein [Candidatus Staskawiczbacteria bacterium]
MKKNEVLVRDVEIPYCAPWQNEQEVFNTLMEEFPGWELVSVIALGSNRRRVYMKLLAK